MIWLYIGLIVLYVLVVPALMVWVAATERWEARAEATRMDRDLRQAEHRLHNLASEAFGSMLDAARNTGSHDWPRLP